MTSPALRPARRVVHLWLSPFTALLLALGLGVPAAALAGWPASPAVNVPVCKAHGSQSYRTAISDGAGGVIVAWSDTRSDTADIYAQRLSAAGDPVWTIDGVQVCGAARDQDQPALTSDGAGGAIIAWRDLRAGATGDLYAQRISASGQLLWATNGVAICTAPDEQGNCVLAGDGFGGAIIAWEDSRATAAIFAQRVSASGVIKWPSNGIPLATGFTPRFQPVILADGQNGAFVAWLQQGVQGYDIAGQHIAIDGTLWWDPAGEAICTASGDQLLPTLALDGATMTGVYVAWEDLRGTHAQVYTQRLNFYGVALWAANGVPACSGSGDQTDPVAATDGSGGCYVAWHDARAGDDIFAQHITGTGQTAWPALGLAVCTASNSQAFPSAASDGQGGVVIAWEDSRAGTSDIYAQRLLGNGSRRWSANGQAVSVAVGSQYQATVVTNRDTVAIVVWVDQRDNGNDLYAQRVPFTVTLDAPAPVAATQRLWSAPEPAPGALGLRFVLPRAGAAELSVFDAAGRRVRTLVRAALPAGERSLAWDARDDAGAALPAGAYFARLSLAGETLATRRITLRR